MEKGAKASSDDATSKLSWNRKCSTFKTFYQELEKEHETKVYIANTAWAMFCLYTKRNKEEKAKGVADGAAFHMLWDSMFDPDVSKVRDAAMLEEMTDVVEHRDYDCIGVGNPSILRMLHRLQTSSTQTASVSSSACIDELSTVGISFDFQATGPPFMKMM
eukprot:141563-Rhodomonas_salina.1